MMLFQEVEGVYVAAGRKRLYHYRGTYVVRGDRIAWTATLQSTGLPASTMSGMGIVMRNTVLERTVRQQIHQAIETDDWTRPAELSPSEAA